MGLMSTPDNLSRLDDVDRRLTELLMEDGRMSYAALAPQIGLSQAATRIRVQRLLDERIIDVNARVDPAVLGYGVYAFVLMSARGPVGPVATQVTAVPEAVFVVHTSGGWDLLVEVRASDNAALVRVLDRLRTIEAVNDLEVLTVLRYSKQDWSKVGVIGERAPSASKHTGQRPHDIDLDDIDVQLVHHLIADGRASFADLAQRVGLSHPASRDRVLRLLDDVVAIHAVPGPGATDHLLWSAAFVRLSTDSESFITELSRRSEVTVACQSAGRFAALAEIWCDDHDHLVEFTEWIRSLDGVEGLVVLQYLKILKQEFEGGAV